MVLKVSTRRLVTRCSVPIFARLSFFTASGEMLLGLSIDTTSLFTRLSTSKQTCSVGSRECEQFSLLQPAVLPWRLNCTFCTLQFARLPVSVNRVYTHSNLRLCQSSHLLLFYTVYVYLIHWNVFLVYTSFGKLSQLDWFSLVTFCLAFAFIALFRMRAMYC